MRKRLIEKNLPDDSTEAGAWLDLQGLASVEVTSEQADFPIESVFGGEQGAGWRASAAGEQVIRLIFDEPQNVRRIEVRFSETDVERTQEFLLQWAPRGGAMKEIVRQQWNFSPDGAKSEVEDYQVDLNGVSVLQLTINPDITHGHAPASLSQWRVA